MYLVLQKRRWAIEDKLYCVLRGAYSRMPHLLAEAYHALNGVAGAIIDRLCYEYIRLQNLHCVSVSYLTVQDKKMNDVACRIITEYCI